MPKVDASGPSACIHRLADGQRCPLPLFDGRVLLSFEAAAPEKKLLDSLAAGGEWPTSWWSSSWFPFATDNAGRFLVIDDQTKQVIAFEHDDDARPVLGESFEAYVRSIVEGLESGLLVLDLKVGLQSRANLERWAAGASQRAAADRMALRAKLVLAAMLLLVLAAVFVTWLRG